MKKFSFFKRTFSHGKRLIYRKQMFIPA